MSSNSPSILTRPPLFRQQCRHYTFIFNKYSGCLSVPYPRYSRTILNYVLKKWDFGFFHENCVDFFDQYCMNMNSLRDGSISYVPDTAAALRCLIILMGSRSMICNLSKDYWSGAPGSIRLLIPSSLLAGGGLPGGQVSLLPCVR